MPDIRLNIKFFTALIKLTFPRMFFSYNFFLVLPKQNSLICVVTNNPPGCKLYFLSSWKISTNSN